MTGLDCELNGFRSVSSHAFVVSDRSGMTLNAPAPEGDSAHGYCPEDGAAGDLGDSLIWDDY
jgi:hypothetical protein